MACAEAEQVSMRSLLIEQLEQLRGMTYEGAGADEEFDLRAWVGEIATFAGMSFQDEIHREACAYAWGYLRGCAEYADLTLDQLLDEYDLTWNDGDARRQKEAV